jgi:hypothetical protein
MKLLGREMWLLDGVKAVPIIVYAKAVNTQRDSKMIVRFWTFIHTYTMSLQKSV